MANHSHFELLEKGVQTWNQWRRDHPEIRPDLSRMDLSQMDLGGINFFGANLIQTTLCDVNLSGANLTANLSSSRLERVNLSGANLAHALLSSSRLERVNLSGANLTKAALPQSVLWNVNLSQANLRGGHLNAAYIRDSDLSEANLSNALLAATVFIRTSLRRTNFTGCQTEDEGAAFWKVDLTEALGLEALQPDFHLMPYLDPAQLAVTVEDPDLAGFLATVLRAERIGDKHGPLDCGVKQLGTSLVLIIGCFEGSRKAIAEVLCSGVRARGYVPMICNGECLATYYKAEELRTYCQGISLLKNLVHLSDFTLVDLTGLSAFDEKADILDFFEEVWGPDKSEHQGILGMLEYLVGAEYSSTFQPLLHTSNKGEGERMNFSEYPRMLPLHCYKDLMQLQAFLQEAGIDAIEKAIGKE